MTDIYVVFNGNSPITSASSGTVELDFGAVSADGSYDTAPSASGRLASIRRAGLAIQVNGARNTYGNGSSLYQSLLRITNNGGLAGAVTVTLKNSTDGSMLGEWTSDMINPDAMIQVSVGELEEEIGLNPMAHGFYTINVDGPIKGYVQHVNWNSVDNLFSDLSAFRSTEITVLD